MTHRRSRSAAALAGCAALCAGLPARAAARRPDEPLPSGHIHQIISANGHLLAIRDGEILIFAADGTRLGRCARPAVPGPRRARVRAGAPDAAEILHDGGLPDDDSTLAAEELIEDELERDPRRRGRGSPARSVVPRALAAGGGAAWAATSDGVYQVDAQRCARVALAGRDLAAIAAGGGALAAASDDQLFRAELTGAAPAGGWWFRPIAALPGRPRALAVDGRGTVLVADAEGVLAIGPPGNGRRVFRGQVDALVACGDDATALARDGVYRWDGARFQRAGERPPVGVLACGDAPERRWMAGGRGLWSSADGAAWTPQPAGLGATVDGVAAVGGRVWIATDFGLTPAWIGRGPPVGAAPLVDRIEPGPARTRPAAPALWSWPTVTAAVMVDDTSRHGGSWARRTVTAFVLLRFPFDRVRAARGDLSALALDRRRRQAELARVELAAQAAAASAADPADADEMAAWRALAADEREALR